jgi:hypothetical protein
MIILPQFINFFLIALLSSLTFLGVRKALITNLSLCVNEATSIQTQHKKLTLKLLNMNPIAKKLRASRKMAELAHRTAPPHLKPATLAALKAVKTSQRVFHYKQLSLINAAKALSIKSNLSFLKNGFSPIKMPRDLEVEKVQNKSDSPDYKLKHNYEENKKIEYFKYFSLLKYLPQFLVNYLKPEFKIKKISCGSTLIKKGERPWKTKLILDKF